MTRNPAQVLREVKQAIREPHARLGGYPLFILMADGESLSTEAARDNWRSICHATITESRDGWQAYGADVNWEDAELTCAHTGARISSAYGD